METDISLSWLTVTGMAATIVISIFIIVLTRLVRVFFVRGENQASEAAQKDVPLEVILTAAAFAMQEGASARNLSVPEGGRSAWSARVREDSSRFQGGTL